MRSYAVNSSGTGYGQPQTFTAGATPVADFTVSTTTVVENQSLQFTDQSANHPTSWSWNFGDGTTSNQQNPSKSYTTAGTYTVSLTATNNHGHDIMTKTEYIIIKPAPLTDARDGKVYQTVLIGNQIWMAENLAYLPSVNLTSDRSLSSSRYYVYGYYGTNVSTAKATSSYKTYGALYNWPAATKACPTGWHLPTDAEWKQLEMYLGMSQTQADRNAENRGTNQGSKLGGNASLWASGVLKSNPEFGATGFSALPGGWMDMNGNFSTSDGIFGFWWSSTKYGSSSAWYRIVHRNYTGVSRAYATGSMGASVRCIRD
ncbi:MAG: FISUMP domain-containing protein [Bacteroidales bacterium]